MNCCSRRQWCRGCNNLLPKIVKVSPANILLSTLFRLPLKNCTWASSVSHLTNHIYINEACLLSPLLSSPTMRVFIYLDIDGVLLPHPPTVNSRCRICLLSFYDNSLTECFTNEELPSNDNDCICLPCARKEGFSLTTTFPNRCVEGLKKTIETIRDQDQNPRLILSSTWR